MRKLKPNPNKEVFIFLREYFKAVNGFRGKDVILEFALWLVVVWVHRAIDPAPLLVLILVPPASGNTITNSWKRQREQTNMPAYTTIYRQADTGGLTMFVGEIVPVINFTISRLE
jgi:hypothetical protein